MALVDALAAVGCSRTPSPPHDAAQLNRVDARDVTSRARGRRRRRVRSAAVAQIPANPGNRPASPVSAGAHVASLPPEDLNIPDEEPDDPAPRARPRITETGPLLPEDLGRPTNVSMDLTSPTGASQGPMGLEPSQISHGLNPLLGRFSRCADATSDDQGHGPHGRVGVRLRIRNDGNPIAARVSGGGGSAEFVTCVRRVVAAARFNRFAGPDVFATWGFDVD